MYKKLPNSLLIKNHINSDKFLSLGIADFHDACDFVWKLPYGRTSDGKNWKLVLVEKTGTCSTKHALLKALASELNLEIDLILGIYHMTESNTPGVGKVLGQTRYDYIPEAHCYLKYNKTPIDLTRYGINAEEPISKFYDEIVIEPDEIGTKKKDFHQSFIKRGFGQDSFNEIWQLRELCIEGISTKQTHKPDLTSR